MTSSTSTSPETAALICRFLAGELPLFAAEAWLKGPALGHETTQRPLGHEAAQRPLLLDFDWSAPDLHARLEARLAAELAPGFYRRWLLERHLPWILSEEPRACLSVARCSQLQQQGLRFLAPIAEALAEGRLDEGFDWDRVRQVIPLLKPAASLILHALASEELQLGAADYVLDAQMRGLLETNTDWRGANARIAVWQAQHRHLLPQHG